MAELFHPIGIGMLKNMLHHEQKNRLDNMKKYNLERNRKNHNDFLSKIQDTDEVNDHTARIEHHGLHFWTRCFPGERPAGVLRNDRIPVHEYGTYEERDAMETYLLTPSSACVEFDYGIPNPDAMKADVESVQRWVDHLRLAEAALHCNEYVEAERIFRLALAEVARWSAPDPRVAETLLGLASALSAQRKYDESDKLSETARKIKSQFTKKPPKE